MGGRSTYVNCATGKRWLQYREKEGPRERECLLNCLRTNHPHGGVGNHIQLARFRKENRKRQTARLIIDVSECVERKQVEIHFYLTLTGHFECSYGDLEHSEANHASLSENGRKTIEGDLRLPLANSHTTIVQKMVSDRQGGNVLEYCLCYVEEVLKAKKLEERNPLLNLSGIIYGWFQKPMCHLNMGKLMDAQERHITNHKCRDSGVLVSLKKVVPPSACFDWRCWFRADLPFFPGGHDFEISALILRHGSPNLTHPEYPVTPEGALSSCLESSPGVVTAQDASSQSHITLAQATVLRVTELELTTTVVGTDPVVNLRLKSLKHVLELPRKVQHTAVQEPT
ncbi:hypothetical protein J6590_036585 [Homalodisca vitripennis]|nr:hypothetical protein J6590_036585 [Homalodisca vitripennis]